MKRAPRSRQRHDLYAKYHDYDSEISDLLGECGLKGHPQFVCHGLTEFHRLKGSGRGIEEALGSNRQRRGW